MDDIERDEEYDAIMSEALAHEWGIDEVNAAEIWDTAVEAFGYDFDPGEYMDALEGMMMDYAYEYDFEMSEPSGWEWDGDWSADELLEAGTEIEIGTEYES